MMSRYHHRKIASSIRRPHAAARFVKKSVLDDGVMAVPAPNRDYSRPLTPDADMLRYIEKYKSGQLIET
jgi:hypothetical protein